MRSAALLLGFCATTACSLDHVVVAALDTGGAAGALMALAGSSSAGADRVNVTAGGLGGEPASAGSGGTGTGGAQAESDAGSVVLASGGAVDNTIIGTLNASGGGSSETRCSCVSRQAQICGTDGLTYPRDCADPSTCAPPAIACLQACPCLDDGVDSGGAADFRWFPAECVSSARCTDGVICMTFSNVTFEDTPTTCVLGN